MVKRLLLISALLVTALLLAVLLGGGHWLLRTPEGLRWLLASVSRWTPVTVSAEQIEGALWGELRLKELQVSWPGGEALSDALLLRWQPAALVRRRLSVDELDLGRVEVRWQAPEPAPLVVEEREVFELAWPQLDDGLPGITAVIGALRAERLALGSRDAEPLVLSEIHVGLGWQDGVLEARDLGVTGDFGRLSGDLGLGLVVPRFQGALQWRGSTPVAGVDGCRLDLDLVPDGALVARGPLAIALTEADAPRFAAQGRLELAATALSLADLTLRRANAPDEVRGHASLDWRDGPRYQAQLELRQVDLGPEIGWVTALSGTLEAQGDFVDYAGRLDLANALSGWEKARLQAEVKGDTRGLGLKDIQAQWLGGTLAGQVDMDWQTGFALDAKLAGRRLDPSVIDGAPAGRLNLDVQGGLRVSPEAGLSAGASGRFLDSLLFERPFAGEFAADWEQDDLIVHALQLTGEGLHLEAAGRLAQKLDVALTVESLAVLVPELEGSARAEGWLALRDGRPGGELQAEGAGLRVADLRLERWQVRADLPNPQAPGRISARLDDLRQGELRLRQVDAEVAGLIDEHQLQLALAWSAGSVRTQARGGWREGAWRGVVESLSGEDRDLGGWRTLQPATLTAGPAELKIADLLIAADGGGDLRLDAALIPEPLSGFAEVSWRRFNLEHFNYWLSGMQLGGETAGDVELRLHSSERLDLFGDLSVSGMLATEGGILDLEQGGVSFAWDGSGLELSGNARLADFGALRWQLASPQPGAPLLPETGRLEAAWDGMELAVLAEYLPVPVELRGRLEGELSGTWGPDLTLDLAGGLRVNEGHLRWHGEDGEIGAELRSAALDWSWRGDAFAGQVDLRLADYGEARGDFRLPLPARLPTAFDDEAPLSAHLTAQVRERGLLATFLPGLADETAGDLQANLSIGGSARAPEFGGDFALTGAGALLPATGTSLRDLELRGELAAQQLRITSFGVTSGPGRLEGRGQVDFRNWQFASFQFQLDGSNFQVADLPEVEIRVSPALRLDGAPGRLNVGGEVRVPLFVVTGWQARTPVQRSPDVIIVDGEGPEPERELPFALALNLRLLLGESVVIKLHGLDARLGGDLTLLTNERNAVIGRGEIRVEQGHYSSYGIRLPITRGRLFFPGGPVERPTLDILAMRTIGEVKAGVQVSGTPQVPVVKLYSEPGMPDTDILAYIVLGRPLGAGQGQVDALMLAAGALLSQGESAAMQDKLQRRLGIDVFEVQAGDGDVAGSMVTIGKYLTPDLYISFGQSLFGEGNVARMRYSLTESWQVESQLGEVSGADLFYRLEFR
ncbi:translocation/assembly module TamB domain-containing protein [Geoalkalibacter sp.]|uniref:translocation/assembly module TamB domain-containing protein n=1 Tax=Geoalkalibacter sp. TaxID=3041440 RepID=UPI00272E9517|nr:translocation/assembly module TamB domain-containing protein [Geoalkalibacter sp.]